MRHYSITVCTYEFMTPPPQSLDFRVKGDIFWCIKINHLLCLYKLKRGVVLNWHPNEYFQKKMELFTNQQMLRRGGLIWTTLCITLKRRLSAVYRRRDWYVCRTQNKVDPATPANRNGRSRLLRPCAAREWTEVKARVSRSTAAYYNIRQHCPLPFRSDHL